MGTAYVKHLLLAFILSIGIFYEIGTYVQCSLTYYINNNVKKYYWRTSEVCRLSGFVNEYIIRIYYYGVWFIGINNYCVEKLNIKRLNRLARFFIVSGYPLFSILSNIQIGPFTVSKHSKQGNFIPIVCLTLIK